MNRNKEYIHVNDHGNQTASPSLIAQVKKRERQGEKERNIVRH